MNTPLTFHPNLKSAKHNATEGYNWGKRVIDSNILKDLKFVLKVGEEVTILKRKLEKLGIEETDVVSERWIVSDDKEASSISGMDTLKDLLAKHGEDILGKQHIREHGPYLKCIMKIIDPAKSLSVQVHPPVGHQTLPSKPECWLTKAGEQMEVYLGLNDDVSEIELKQAAEDGNLEAYMNLVTVSRENPVVVKGGMLHAIRGSEDVALYEWSKAPGGMEEEKGSLKDATVSAYDKTDGKEPREGKENFDQAMEVMKDAGMFRKSTQEDWNANPENVEIDTLGNVRNALFRTEDFFVDELKVATTLHIDLKKRGLPIYLESGEVEIYKNNIKIAQLGAGQEMLLPSSLGEVKIVNTPFEESVLFTWYAPFAEELLEMNA